MARYWIALVGPDDGEVEYEPINHRPTRRDAPNDGRAWAFYDDDFLLLRQSNDWRAAMARLSGPPRKAPQ